VIVDSSAIVAIIRHESGWTELKDRLLSSRDARISAGTMIELQMVTDRPKLREGFAELIVEAALEIIPVDARQVELAYDGFRRFGKGRHPAGLDFGDLFAYALARALDEPLLYVGTDFGLTDVRSAV